MADAQERGKGEDVWKRMPLLMLLPVVGPALYMLLRPKTYNWPMQNPPV